MTHAADAGASQRRSPRARLALALVGLLYRSRVLYWLASTIPFAGQWRRWQCLALDEVIGRDVLEVGCGTGDLLADLVARGHRCAAVDRSPAMVRAARRTLARRGLAHGGGAGAAIARLADVRALPFEPGSFDTVVSTFPTDYIQDPRALGEIARVLRPGGRLVIVLGAALLPASVALWPAVALQWLVYGRARGPRATCVWASDAPPLARQLAVAGLDARMACVRGPFWVAYRVTAVKRP